MIGKDIIWFHCVIWPALLLATGVPLPRTVFAHGFVNGPDGQKMSKSLGNVVDPCAAPSRLTRARTSARLHPCPCTHAPPSAAAAP